MIRATHQEVSLYLLHGLTSAKAVSASSSGMFARLVAELMKRLWFTCAKTEAIRAIVFDGSLYLLHRL